MSTRAHDDTDTGHERRTEIRHDAKRLGEVTARLVGGSVVRLVNFSNRGILVESDTRLLIGARASVRITTRDGVLLVTGRVVRSRVKGLVNGVLLYDAGLNLDSELSLAPTEPEELPAPPAADDAAVDPADSWEAEDAEPRAVDDAAMLQLFASVPQGLAELRKLAVANQW